MLWLQPDRKHLLLLRRVQMCIRDSEDSIQKAQVLTTAANVKLGEIQAIDYSWGEIDFVTKPLNEMRLMECTECEMSAPGAYDIDIEADDINVTDTATVIWEIA